MSAYRRNFSKESSNQIADARMFPVRRSAYAVGYVAYCLAAKTSQFPRVLEDRTPRFLADETVAPAQGDRFAIVVKYAGFGVTEDFTDLLASLVRARVNPIVVCNGELKADEMAALRPHAHRILTRRNTGRDFGAYRAATLHLHRTGLRPSRLLYFNDSLLYLRGRELDALTEAMASGQDDVAGTFENHEFVHHLGSFAFAISGEVFADPRVLEFWQSYRPYDLRPHAIQRGEIGYSECLRRCGYRFNVIYSADKLADRLDAMPWHTLVGHLRYLPIGHFHDYAVKDILAGASSMAQLLNADRPNPPAAPPPRGTPRLSDYQRPGGPTREEAEARKKSALLAGAIRREVLVNHIMELVTSRSQIHYGFGLFHRVLGSPLVKRDLLLRGLLKEHHCNRILDHLPADRRGMVIRELLNRGRPVAIRGMRRFKQHTGLA